MKKNSISICFITKNEEKNLTRCLKTIKNLVDEIVVVDTGSNDKTVEIAKKNQAKVYLFPWIEDFSAARNFALSKATQEWTMWLDADDLILKNFIQNLKHEILTKTKIETDGLLIPYVISRDKHGQPQYFTNRLRIFRTKSKIRFKYPIHEILETKGKKLEQVKNLYVLHAPEPGKSSFQRNTAILLKAQQTKKYKNDFHILFHLGKEYQSSQQIDKAFTYFHKALINAKSITDKYYTLLKLAQCKLIKKDKTASMHFAFEALKTDPKRPEAFETLAKIKSTNGKTSSSDFWNEMSKMVPQKLSNQLMKWNQ